MFLKSLPDKGKKIADMVKKLKQLIAEKEEFNSTMSRLEKMNISKKPAHAVMDSDNDDDIDDHLVVDEGRVEAPNLNICQDKPSEKDTGNSRMVQKSSQ